MASNKITLSISSSKGRQRLQVEQNINASALKDKVRQLLGLREDFKAFQDDGRGRPGKEEIKLTSRYTTIISLGLKNRDTIHIFPLSGTNFEDVSHQNGTSISNSQAQNVTESDGNASKSAAFSSDQVLKDDVDNILATSDGKIEQARTSFCNHNENSRCILCAPKDPYDEEYLKSKDIKFMSFHSYLKKLENEKGSFAKTSLDEIQLKIQPDCTNHSPWPEGLCTSCKPPAITLNRQSYRHVDYVTFENKDIVDNFLKYWRETSHQRAGILYGRYEPFNDVPLGIKAVVTGIYEPKQISTNNSIKILPDDVLEKVDWIARSLGSRRVGWIFTDLVAKSTSGCVEHIRRADSHFLSAQECINAGYFQNMYPNVIEKPGSQLNKSKYGSKQITVVVTGNSEEQIGVEAYQVSQQCMALVKAGVLLPTKDAPELAYVREPTVGPSLDVSYKSIDQFGNEVLQVARPLPVEYLLIDIPSGVSSAMPRYTMSVKMELLLSGPSFPIENRPIEGHLQTLQSLAKYRKRFGPANGDLVMFFRDFHVLVYLATQNDVPFAEKDMKPLLEALRDGRLNDLCDWMKENEQWKTLDVIFTNIEE